MNPSQAIISALGANMIIFAAAWAWCVRLKNFSPVDAFWAICIGLTSLFFLLIQSPDPKQITATMLIGAWSARLGFHLSKRIAKHHPEEDSRYIKLREIWQGRENPAFFWFFQGQALSVFLLALPFYLIAADPDPAGADADEDPIPTAFGGESAANLHWIGGCWRAPPPPLSVSIVVVLCCARWLRSGRGDCCAPSRGWRCVWWWCFWGSEGSRCYRRQERYGD